MPGGAVTLATTSDVNAIEAPMTWKAYLICAFASFGGIFFGYDSGYINGVIGSTKLVILSRFQAPPSSPLPINRTSSSSSLLAPSSAPLLRAMSLK